MESNSCQKRHSLAYQYNFDAFASLAPFFNEWANIELKNIFSAKKLEEKLLNEEIIDIVTSN